MASLKEAVDEFLGQKRIAIAGVSRTPNQPANLIFRTLRKASYEVFAVNPNADTVEGQACYHDLASIPGGVDAVVVATTPAVADNVVHDCARLGVHHVWMHRSFGTGSVSPSAEQYCREHDIQVIAGGCPMMFVPGADLGHRCMRWVLGFTGGLPRDV